MKTGALPDRAQKRIPAPRAKDGLGHGHWVNRHGIRVWVDHTCPDCGGLLLPKTRCETCLLWAMKAARDCEWARISRANRHRVWPILDLLNERKRAA